LFGPILLIIEMRSQRVVNKFEKESFTQLNKPQRKGSPVRILVLELLKVIKRNYKTYIIRLHKQSLFPVKTLC
jgi:hypothetical protein